MPAFARKYQSNCALCHSNEPRLTAFGQKFLANGYQFPSTEDGATVAKKVLEGEQGPVTLDDVSNMVAMRIRGDISKSSFESASANPGLEDMMIEVPTKFNFFVAGTATKNLSYFVETEVEEQWHRERAFLQFSNIVKPGLANVKVGTFDPSSLFSFPTHRQQMNPIGPALTSDPATSMAEIERIPVVPLAFTYKFYGLRSEEAPAGGAAMILPFAPSLYNAPMQTGISVHGQPLGDALPLTYQIGIAHNETATGKQRQDTYGMLRYNMSLGGIETQVSGFYYAAPDAAALTDSMMTGSTQGVTDITRTGFGARAQWSDFDVYGAYIMDSIDASTAAMPAMWSETASALSLEGDWRMSNKLMVGARYDSMSAGGMNAMIKDASFLGLIGKYYTSPNIGLYARYHMNLASAEASMMGFSGQHPAGNLSNTLALGVDMAF